MDLYLERHWGDVHPSFLVYARNQLNAQLPDDLQARVEESVGALLLEDEPRTERHLEIVELQGRGRVVTVIEVLSPANKVGIDGRAAYVRRQREYLEAGVNLVEIDLVREGDFVLAAPERRIPSAVRAPYLICVRRAATWDRAELYSVPLRRTLPAIPIPLRPSDRDVVLELQPIIDACYCDGRYHRIDYRVDPIPRFGEEDSRWIDQLLREKCLR
jgi:hypothetical protein